MEYHLKMRILAIENMEKSKQDYLMRLKYLTLAHEDEIMTTKLAKLNNHLASNELLEVDTELTALSVSISQ